MDIPASSTIRKRILKRRYWCATRQYAARKLYDPQEDTETLTRSQRVKTPQRRKLYDPQEDTETDRRIIHDRTIIPASSTIRKRILKPCP